MAFLPPTGTGAERRIRSALLWLVLVGAGVQVLLTPVAILGGLGWTRWLAWTGSVVAMVAVALTLAWLVASWRGRRQIEARRGRVCPDCLYDLADLAGEGRCPECGRLYTFAGLEREWSRAYASAYGPPEE